MATKPVIVKDKTNAQINPATDESLILLRKLFRVEECLGVVDTYQRQRVVVDSAVIASGTVTTVSTLSAITTQPVNQLYEMMDRSRMSFAMGIRNNMSF
jgi:hypothetical protein